MIQEPPPKIENKWLTKQLESTVDWCRRHFCFPGDSSIVMEEKPDGLKTTAQLTSATELQPLQLIASPTDASPYRVRVVLGGILWGGIFWYADADMNVNEDGLVGKEYFYVEGLDDGDSIWVELTVSFDGMFWRVDSSSVESGPVVTATSATKATLLLGTVNVTDDVLTVTKPQTIIGNFGGRRMGVVTTYQDEYWPLIAAS